MSKKTLIITSVLVILIAAAITSYFLVISKKGVSLPSDSQKEAEVVVEADVLYEDAAGFSFKHPKETKVADVTPEESEYYTQLTLAKGGEKLTIAAKDTTAKNIEDWLKSDAKYASSTLVGATPLGGISAKQYATKEVLLTVAIDQGVLYLIEGPKDGDFWEAVQNAVVSTFEFAGSTSGAGRGGSDIIYEEEEVVE